jgi:hypothetical protein
MFILKIINKFIMDWFEKLFGFKEKLFTPDEICKKFKLSASKLISIENLKEYEIGKFECKSLKELRQIIGTPGVLKFKNIATNDVFLLHSAIENKNALFQVASQFNCLESKSQIKQPHY